MHALMRGSLPQRLRLAAGLVLFVFVITHFVNHALGLVNLEPSLRLGAAVDGHLVRTVLNENMVPGTYRQVWDGTNDRGRPLGPGLYFVQIVVAGNKQTLKVMIVR